MNKNLFYLSATWDPESDERHKSVKIGVVTRVADERMLRGDNPGYEVELLGVWSFENAPVTAEDVEKAVRHLLRPAECDGEWFWDFDGDLADNLAIFAQQFGGQPVQSPRLRKMNKRQRAALAQMRAVFDPVAARLEQAGVNWEYMIWKVGMDSPYGRLIIEVLKSGNLAVRLDSRRHDAEFLWRETGVQWRDGAESRRHADMAIDQLLGFMLKP